MKFEGVDFEKARNRGIDNQRKDYQAKNKALADGLETSEDVFVLADAERENMQRQGLYRKKGINIPSEKRKREIQERDFNLARNSYNNLTKEEAIKMNSRGENIFGKGVRAHDIRRADADAENALREQLKNDQNNEELKKKLELMSKSAMHNKEGIRYEGLAALGATGLTPIELEREKIYTPEINSYSEKPDMIYNEQMPAEEIHEGLHDVAYERSVYLNKLGKEKDHLREGEGTEYKKQVKKEEEEIEILRRKIQNI